LQARLQDCGKKSNIEPLMADIQKLLTRMA
jgi:hypothetical protein